jgi:hypothetical protein
VAPVRRGGAVVFEPGLGCEAVAAGFREGAAFGGQDAHERAGRRDEDGGSFDLRPEEEREDHRGEAGRTRPALPEDEPERAESDEGHHEGLWRGDVGDCAGECRDGAGDEEDPVYAGLHEAEADFVQAEGREEGREDGGGHDEDAHDGDGQRVGEEAVVLELVEVGGGEGGRGEARDEGGEEERREGAGHARQAGFAVAPGLESGDEGDGGGEGHLEAGLGQRLGAEGEDDDGGERHGAQGQRAAVEEDGDQHDGYLHEGAFGGDVHARECEVEGARDEGRGGGDLLGGQAQGKRRDGGEREPDEAEDEACHQHHVKARDREDVLEARDAQRLGRLGVDGGADAGGDGGREAARGAGDYFRDLLRDRHAEAVDEEARPALLGRPQREDGGARVAHGAQAVEEGLALEVEAARLHRAFGGGEVTREDDGKAGFGGDPPLVPVERDADAGGCAVGRDVAEDDAVEGEAGLVGLGAVDDDDAAFDGAVVAEGEDRVGDGEGAEARDADPSEEGEGREEERLVAQAGRGEHEAGGKGEAEEEPTGAVGFFGESEVGADTHGVGHGHPGEEVAALMVEDGGEASDGSRPCPAGAGWLHPQA